MIQELRIGNFVSQLYSFGCDGTKKPEWREWELDLIDIQDVQSRPEIYKPIPLTEEWFLRLGFDYHKPFNDEDSDFYVFKIESDIGESITFAFVSDELGWLTDRLMITIKTHYVHQLQNLYFALTGQELKLNEK